MTPAQVAHIMALVRNHGELSAERAQYLVLRRSMSDIEAALRDAPQAEGWVMVPVEPDETMEAVGDMNLSCGAPDVYRAMLAARPSAPTAVEPVRERWLCLSCLSDRTGYHRTLDDKVTPCPQGAARASKGTP